MTWGKALLSWTPSPEEALARAIDLNHRFALDGRDPNSYGGILWCFGQFDRPFQPERPVTGVVRPRATAQHARRLDVEAYRARTSRAAVEPPLRIAVIGGGISGLTCARTLGDHGLHVTVFDRGRGPGGRASTRRTEHGSFDHGAQYFTVRDSRFDRAVASWIEESIVAEWTAPIVTLRDGACVPTASDTRRYVGVPGMSALARHLGRDCDVQSGAQVVEVRRRSGDWELGLGDGTTASGFDVVILALPAPQAQALAAVSPTLASRLSEVELSPCWALLVGFEEQLDTGFGGAFVEDSALAWIAREATKPGRSGHETWVAHSTSAWATTRVDAAPEQVRHELTAALERTLARPLPPTAAASAHRWRFAQPKAPLGSSCLFDPADGIGACGDWCVGGRIEGAYLSGAAMAGAVLRRAGQRPITASDPRDGRRPFGARVPGKSLFPA
jgi:predicted NAD/FAD-dependent oxidoreductase